MTIRNACHMLKIDNVTKFVEKNTSVTKLNIDDGCAVGEDFCNMLHRNSTLTALEFSTKQEDEQLVHR